MVLKTDSPPSYSILFVEDDEVILELQSSIIALKFPDVMILTAIEGRLGLELFKEHAPEIVITDINMSKMCGVQMAENIRAIKPETKIIATTGKSGDTSANKAIMCSSDGNVVEFDHVIIKPIDISELCAVIEKCFDEIKHRIS